MSSVKEMDSGKPAAVDTAVSESGKNESARKIEEFLEEVNEQIRYKPMRAAIDEELKGHIEDKTELYKEYGLEEEEAVARAVRDMGDAVEIGIQMNDAHHTRIYWPLMGMALVLMVLGVAGNIRYFWNGTLDIWFLNDVIAENLYFPAGVVALLVVLRWGYPFVIRYVNKICVCYLVFCGFVFLIRFSSGFLYDILKGTVFAGRLLSLSVYFGVLILAAPVLAVFLYRQRHKGVRGILYAGLFTGTLLLTQVFRMYGDYLSMAVFALLATFFAVLLYMAFRGYMDMPVKKTVGVSAAVFLALLLLGGIFRPDNSAIELFLTPERHAGDLWEDGYNGVLIKELLGRAKPAGRADISQEDLYAYGTGKWYFSEDGPGRWEGIQTLEEMEAYLNQFYQEDTVTLENILPQHYQNNYRIAYWILKYGWLPAILLMGAMAVFGALLLGVSFHIRNRLGRLVAFAGSICLIIQYLFYFLGNFGYQFGWFGTLPFVSEGKTGILVNAVLLGLVLSAYRYDLVMEERMHV